MDNEARERAVGEGGRPAQPWEVEELQRLTADIAARLRKSSAHLSDAEFSALVQDIARRRLRHDRMDPVDPKGRRGRRPPDG